MFRTNLVIHHQEQRAPDDEWLDSFETCSAAKKLWNKIDYKNCESCWSLTHWSFGCRKIWRNSEVSKRCMVLIVLLSTKATFQKQLNVLGGREPMEYVGADGRTSSLSSSNIDGGTWNGFVWLRIGTSGGPSWKQWWTFGSHTIPCIYLRTGEQLAFREGLCSIDSISLTL